MKQLSNALNAPPIQLAIAGVIILGFVYYLTRKTISDVGSATGFNTAGTPFEGAGVVGVVGNVVNKATGGVLASAGERISRYFAPLDDPSPNLFYTATFPDGQRHAIASTLVDKSGFFFYKGLRYRLAFNTETPAKRVAVQA